MATAKPKVSIAVPLYNNAGHVNACLQSIRAQTYEHWDCIVVDNCSTDGSGRIAGEYAADDPRIRVHNNFRFLSAIENHNAALRLMGADSKYFKIVFADDWIFPECLERMVDVAEKHPSVGVVGAYRLEGTRVTCSGLPYPSTVVSGREACRSHLLKRIHVFGSANSVLYRADLVRDRSPFFNEDNIHADTEVCFALLRNSDFGFVHQVLTYTRMREGSLRDRSEKMQTSLAGWLNLLVSFGPVYLSSFEFNELLVRHLRDYYRFLGKRVLFGKNREVWNYHRSTLEKAGVGFSRVRVVRGTLEMLAHYALNPLTTTQRLLRRLSSRSV